MGSVVPVAAGAAPRPAGGPAGAVEAVTVDGPTGAVLAGAAASCEPSTAWRKSRMARPSAAPVSGSFPGPMTRSAIARMMTR